MAKLPIAFFIVVIVMAAGCNNNQTSFEDSVPYLHTLTTNVSPEGSGVVQPSGGEFIAGNRITIEARPSDGFVFDRWEVDLTGNSNPDSLIFTANRSVTAHFIERYYPLSIEVIGEGIVREEVTDSTVVTVKLTAVSSAGWYFDRWEGNLSGNENPETIDVDEEKSVVAVFRQHDPQGLVIDVKVEGQGSVEFDPEKDAYDEDEEVTVTAVASSGWSFMEWKGDLSGSENPVTILMNENKAITAVFEESTGPDASNSTVTVDQDQLQAGMNAAVTVELRDNNNNPVGGLSDDDFTISLSGDAAFGSISEISNGTYQFDVTSTTTGEVGITVTANGVVLNDTAVITFEAADADVIEIEIQPKDSRRNRPVEGPPTVKVLDEFGNGVPGVEVSVEAIGGSTTQSVSGDLTVTTDDSGTAAFTNIVINHFSVLGASYTLNFSVPGGASVTSESFRVAF